MKDKREFIEEYKGWPRQAVNFLSYYEDGSTQLNTCSLEEWKAYKIKVKLVEAGADEDLVNKLYENAYSIGHFEGGFEAECI